MHSAEPGHPGPRRPYGLVVATIGAGALAVVLIALPYKAFDLDRYFVPKELVLHLTALLATVGALVALGYGTGGRGRRPVVSLTRADTLLAAFLILSAASTLFAANEWLAARALGISISGALLFWVAQGAARAGRATVLMGALAGAVTLAAVTELLQVYGVESELFSINRSPGGTLGNRNFVAHLVAIGLPTLIAVVLRARRMGSVALGALATTLTAAALVLSRSRGAWVATALAILSILPAAWRAYRMNDESPPIRSGRNFSSDVAPSGASVARRTALILTAAAIGVAGAVTLPNSLNWRSPSPYLDSVLGVTNFREGSGHGRLVQYANTLKLSITHPVLGVGPGNWAVAYPGVAPRSDPSLDSDDGMTANPWPSSDWAAFVSERGVVAAACLALTLLGLMVAALRAASVAARDDRLDRLLPALALSATVVAVVAVGAFDAVLLLPAPSLLAWSTMGVLAGTLVPGPVARMRIGLPAAARVVVAGVVVAGEGAATFHSALQVLAMALFTAAPRHSSPLHTLELAARTDPGSYRIQLRLAESYAHGRSCGRVRLHAGAAHALYPNAPEPRRLLADCRRTESRE